MSGFAVEQVNKFEVVAAWQVPYSVVASAASPPWVCLGQYYLPATVLAKLDVVGMVSASGLTLSVRLWDTTTNQPVNGAVSTTSQAPVRMLGTQVELIGGRIYQVHARCVGTAGDTRFGIVSTATISD